MLTNMVLGCALLVGAETAPSATHPVNANPGQPTAIRFQRQELTPLFYAEGADVGDCNHDGHTDVVIGPYWYLGPRFTTKQEYRPAKAFDKNVYSNAFLTFTHDFNEDGWVDVLVIDWPNKPAHWYENPQGKEGAWAEHPVHKGIDSEAPGLYDVTGDGKPELVFIYKGQYGFAEYDPKNPGKTWQFHPITPVGPWERYTHGLGMADVNGDGKPDLLEKGGWWEQPASGAYTHPWKRHSHDFGLKQGGAQMFAYDLDGDGDNDIITTLVAHGYGVSWFEQIRKGEEIGFIEHKLVAEKPEDTKYGLVFTQAHAMTMADINGDGLLDMVTGKRHWAHNGKDPDATGPVVSYWFETIRANGKADLVPHLLDTHSGVGCQVTAKDVNGDGHIDIIVANKQGGNLLRQQPTPKTTAVSP